MICRSYEWYHYLARLKMILPSACSCVCIHRPGVISVIPRSVSKDISASENEEGEEEGTPSLEGAWVGREGLEGAWVGREGLEGAWTGARAPTKVVTPCIT